MSASGALASGTCSARLSGGAGSTTRGSGTGAGVDREAMTGLGGAAGAGRGVGRAGGAGGRAGAGGGAAGAGVLGLPGGGESAAGGSSTISGSPRFTAAFWNGGGPQSAAATTMTCSSTESAVPAASRLPCHCRRNSKRPMPASIIAGCSPQTSRSSACATLRTRRIRAANLSGLSDCGPSESASSGRGCTSMMRPSAPAATAAMAIDSTYSQ